MNFVQHQSFCRVAPGAPGQTPATKRIRLWIESYGQRLAPINTVLSLIHLEQLQHINSALMRDKLHTRAQHALVAA
jgi:hypothetical protein